MRPSVWPVFRLIKSSLILYSTVALTLKLPRIVVCGSAENSIDDIDHNMGRKPWASALRLISRNALAFGSARLLGFHHQRSISSCDALLDRSLISSRTLPEALSKFAKNQSVPWSPQSVSTDTSSNTVLFAATLSSTLK